MDKHLEQALPSVYALQCSHLRGAIYTSIYFIGHLKINVFEVQHKFRSNDKFQCLIFFSPLLLNTYNNFANQFLIQIST